jgi:hypothetical protein
LSEEDEPGDRFPAWTACSRREADELASCTWPHVEFLDAHRRGRFFSLSLVRTGAPRHRFSTTDFDGCSRNRYSTTELDGCRKRTSPATDFPRGPPVRAAKRTNWLLARGRAATSSPLTIEAASSHYRSFEPAVHGTGSRRRISTGVVGTGTRRRNSTVVGRGRDRRPISRVDRLFAPRSGRTGFLNGAARRRPRRSQTKPLRLAIARSNRRSAAQVVDIGSRRASDEVETGGRFPAWTACSRREADELAS